MSTLPPVAERISSMPRSGIREIMELALADPRVHRLEIGEPDFRTPAHICEAAARAAAEGATTYTASVGIPPLREALADKVTTRNGYPCGPDQIVIGAGGAQVIVATLMTIASPGDEILLPDPSWTNFALMAAIAGLRPVYYPQPAEGGFRPDLDAIEALVTDRTAALLINSPSNPLGVVLDEDETRRLAELAARHGLWLVSDECYDELWFDRPPVAAAALGTEASIVSVYSCSKTYAMTGWRLGYVAAPAALTPNLGKAQEALIGSVNTPTQHAAIAAITGPQDCVVEMRHAYRRRRDLAMAVADELGVGYIRPGGAFYLWVDVRASGTTSRQFALDLVRDELVAVVPGSTFGPSGEGWLRVSLASADDVVRAGIEGIARALARTAGAS